MKPSQIRWFAVALPLVLSGLLVAQTPPPKPAGGKPPVEEEDAPKTQKKKPPVEEEDAPKTKKKPPSEEDEGTKPKKPAPKEEDDKKKSKNPAEMEKDANANKTPSATATGPIDFAKEAAAATQPDVKRLYQSLAIQADAVLMRGNSGLTLIEPLPVYFGSKANSSEVSYRAYGPDGKLSPAVVTIGPGAIVRGVTYEERAYEGALDFLIRMQNYSVGSANYLPRYQCLAIADKVFAAAKDFFDNGRKEKNGPGWNGVRDAMMSKYLDVLVDELNENINLPPSDTKAADRAADVAGHLNELFPDNILAQREYVMWKLSLVSNDLSKLDTEYFKARDSLHSLEVAHPTAEPKLLEKLRDRLRQRAQAHLNESRRLAATDDGKPAALRQADMATKIWPDLPGLQEYYQQLGHNFRLLVVGVRQLPELMSPAMAVTDADRWALDLLFESLVKPVPDGQVGHRYFAGLAKRLPKQLTLGREFELPSDAFWVSSDGTTRQIEANDVRDTLAMMQSKSNSGLAVCEYVDLLSEPTVSQKYRQALRLERGYIDPLGTMSFKILPSSMLTSKADENKFQNREFALAPVGSGPYVYHGRKKEDDREYAVFKANPQYGKRDGKFGLPLIQEIRFVATPANPAQDLNEGRIDMLLNIPTSQLMQVRDPKNGLAMLVTEYTPPNRRIWMLAINHRRDILAGDKGRHLRLAIAYSVNRSKILQEVFRNGTEYHREMNGPFPPGTWAAPLVKDEKQSLFRRDARDQLTPEDEKPGQLTLKYADDPLSKAACDMIQKQAAEAGIDLVPTPLSIADFHRDVIIEHNYELAYMPYDYANELFSLRGLFAPGAKDRGERNFLGYSPNTRITQLLTKIDQTCDFDKVRENTHLLKEPFEHEMPFVPLWQLDFHMVVSKKLETVPSAEYLDPHAIFETIEEWRLNR